MVAKYFYLILGPTNDKKSKLSKSKPLLLLNWKALTEALTSMMVSLTLVYPYFSKPFELETDASLFDLGEVLTQRDENGYSRVKTYASHTLHLNQKSNLAADALSHCPSNMASELEGDEEDDEYETISCSMVCHLLDEEKSWLKLDRELRRKIQEWEEKYCAVKVTSSEVRVVNKIATEKMRRPQLDDKDLA